MSNIKNIEIKTESIKDMTNSLEFSSQLALIARLIMSHNNVHECIAAYGILSVSIIRLSASKASINDWNDFGNAVVESIVGNDDVLTYIGLIIDIIKHASDDNVSSVTVILSPNQGMPHSVRVEKHDG